MKYKIYHNLLPIILFVLALYISLFCVSANVKCQSNYMCKYDINNKQLVSCNSYFIKDSNWELYINNGENYVVQSPLIFKDKYNSLFNINKENMYPFITRTNTSINGYKDSQNMTANEIISEFIKLVHDPFMSVFILLILFIDSYSSYLFTLSSNIISLVFTAISNAISLFSSIMLINSYSLFITLFSPIIWFIIALFTYLITNKTDKYYYKHLVKLIYLLDLNRKKLGKIYDGYFPLKKLRKRYYLYVNKSLIKKINKCLSTIQNMYILDRIDIIKYYPKTYSLINNNETIQWIEAMNFDEKLLIKYYDIFISSGRHLRFLLNNDNIHYI